MTSATILSDNGVSSGSAGIKSSGGNDCSVYWIRCADHTDITKQGYVGISKNVTTRLNHHIKKKQNQHLENAANLHGWDNLVKEIVVISTREYCLELETKLRPTKSIGWNIAVGGGNPPSDFGVKFKKGHVGWKKGMVTPDDVRKKISASLTGRPNRNKGTFVKGMTPWNQGQNMSDETKAKVSKAKKGSKLSAETCAKMSASRMGKTPYKMTDEIKAKISSSLIGNTPWNKGKKSEVPVWNKGIAPSEETRRKISESLKRRNQMLANAEGN